MKKLFRPAIALMNRLRYPHKLMVLGLIYLVAVTVLFYSLYTNLIRDIYSSQRQLEGLALVKPVLTTMRLMQQHRGLEMGLPGHSESMRKAHNAKENEVTAALGELERQLPPDLSSDEGWKKIKTRWDELRSDTFAGTQEESFDAHTDLIDRLQMFTVNIADLRGLTLEPDIGIYYSIETAIETLPVTLEKMGRLRAYGTGILASKHASDHEMNRVLDLITELRNTFRLLTTNLEKTGRYNPELRPRLARVSGDISNLEQQITGLLLTNVLSKKYIVSSEAFYLLSTEAIDEGYTQLFRTFLPTTESLIGKRIQRTENELAVSAAIAGLLLLAATYLIIGGYYSMIEGIRSLVRSAQNYARGDMHERVRLDTRDELSLVGNSFNEMADGFNSLLVTRLEGKERLRSIVDTALDAVIQMNSSGIITGWNRQAEICFGWSYKEAVGRAVGETIIPPRYREAHASGLKRFLESGESKSLGTRVEITGWHRDGGEFPIELSRSAIRTANGFEFNAFIRDITSRKLAENEIQQLAFFDPLTNLPNRRLLIDRLQQALTATARDGEHGALLFIDLDNFKTLNDSLGHDVGDLLLRQVAQRLTGCVREGDTVARLGGDEFVVMLRNLSRNFEEAAFQSETIGEKILASLNQPYLLAGHDCHSTPSIGITLFADHHSTADDVMKRADISMYEAKKAGRNTIRFFDPAVQAAVAARASLETDLRRALENGQFQLYYQVQVNESNRAIGAEALLRWTHPNIGMVPPMQFIPLAEETGLILPIGKWILRTACEQIKKWEASPYTRDLHLAVNISARQFRQPDFDVEVCEIISQTGINPGCLELELTESMVLGDIDDTIGKMQKLRQLGVRFSLDDFGTGYSSLGYLTRLPLNQLKIDQSFVRNVGTKHSDAVIVQTIVGMAKNLGMEVIAEGVETQLQRNFLEDVGCVLYQGYLFSKPVPMAEFEKNLLTSFAAISTGR